MSIMLSFKEFLTEAKGSSSNELYGRAYETGVALNLHKATGSLNNTSKDHQDRIKSIEDAHNDAITKLPEHLRQRALTSALNSSTAYLDSLKNHHGIHPEDIEEVHHTAKGIDHLVGEKTDRIQNPHDVVIKTKSGKLHGASLKATQGTLSNNGIGTVDKIGGIGTKLKEIWDNGKEKIGLGKATTKEIKARRDEPEVKAANRETQSEAASHHAEQFNNASLEDKKHHLRYIMKSGSPAIPYDYVNGEKKKSIPSHLLDHAQAIESSGDFVAKAEPNSNLVKIHDDQGRHIATVEHRPTHGAFSGIQVNTKIGSMKKS